MQKGASVIVHAAALAIDARTPFARRIAFKERGAFGDTCSQQDLTGGEEEELDPG